MKTGESDKLNGADESVRWKEGGFKEGDSAASTEWMGRGEVEGHREEGEEVE